jgi:hypothetical protein
MLGHFAFGLMEFRHAAVIRLGFRIGLSPAALVTTFLRCSLKAAL